MYILKKTQLDKKNVEIEKLKKEDENKKFEDEIHTLKKLIEDKKDSIHELSDFQIDIIKRFITFNKKKTQIELHNEFEKFIKQINLNFIVKIINNIDSVYHKEFTKKYPFLDDNDLTLCYLILLGFKNEQISLILNYSENTIQQKKVDIRKKFGIEEREKIGAFVEEDFKKL